VLEEKEQLHTTFSPFGVVVPKSCSISSNAGFSWEMKEVCAFIISLRCDDENSIEIRKFTLSSPSL
jgi:hypothetical protein